MTLLFDRKYELTIGQPSVATPPQFGESLADGITEIGWQSGDDWRTDNAKDAVLITDLQMTADIKNSSNNAASSGGTTITILNLAKATRNIVERNNNYIILNAGYAQDRQLRMIFSGQVESFETTREGQNLVTTLYCKEGYSPNNSIRITKSFERGDTYGSVFTFLAKAYADNGIPTGDLVLDWVDGSSVINTQTQEAILSRASTDTEPQYYFQLPVMIGKPANTKLLTGYSIMGYLHQALETLCRQTGYVSYITNGKLFIQPKGFTKVVEQFEFTSTQMKSIRKSGSKTTNSSIGGGVEGIKVITFLDGRLDIDKRIKVLDGDHEGTYKIITKAHTLDYEGAAWDTTITCTKDG